MSIDRQRLVEALFLEATDLPEEGRDAFLLARCQGDLELKREVDSLLGAHDDAEGLLDVPQPMTQGLMRQISGLFRADDASIPPSGKIGAYRVIRVLGSGGMGVVYLAEQERPKRTVALKVIRRGLATPSLLRRFEHEAEILGRLHHSGIAQIYEAGVADDGFGPQPYIAMEYIDGRALTDHASIHKLGVREKLVLMARVCEAVQHAHQRGVIHRDLKPGNIFVQAEEGSVGAGTSAEAPTSATTVGGSGGSSLGGTTLGFSGVGPGVGQPKILDFGVARMTEDRAGAHVTTMGTNVGQLIGTLAYMSPEQLGSEGREVDTRSDVYALGVVMFQLITGKLPYDISKLALPEAVRKIKEDAPARLSSFSREYRGDLETIVAKAIEKERGRRYQSAAELGADIHRYLLGEAIAAKRDSALYVLRKQVVRYKSVFGAAAIAVLALISFAVYAALAAERFKAVAAKEKIASSAARSERERADAAAAKLQEELYVSNIERGRLEGVSGKVVVAEELLWSEYFRAPDSPHARWALWEMYEKHPCRWTVQGPADARCVGFNDDVSLVAIGANDRSISILETTAGKEVRRITGLRSVPMSIAFEPGGDRMVVGFANGGACVMPVEEDKTNPVAPVYLVNPAAAHDGAVRTVAWSADGRWIATGGNDRHIRVWDAASLVCIAEWEAHTRGVLCVAFNPQSTMLVSGSSETGPDARVRLWFATTGYPAGEFDVRSSAINGIAFAPDGQMFAAATDDRFAMLHSIDERDIKVLPNKFSGNGASMDFSRDGKRLLGTGGGECRVWFVNVSQEIMSVGQHRDNILGARWTGPGRAISVSEDGAVKSWDVRRAISMRGAGLFGSWCFGTTYSSDGSLLAIASGDGTVAVLDVQKRTRVHTLPTAPELRTRAVRFLKDDRSLLAGSADGHIRVYDLRDGTETARFGSPGSEIFAMALHPNGTTVAIAHRDSAVRLWDLPSRTLIRELRDPRLIHRVEGVDFSPDGKFLACSGTAKGVMLWNAETWQPTTVIDGAAQAWCVTFSHDGKLLAFSTWGDTVELWDVQNARHLGAMTGHRGLVSTIAFSPNDEYLASGGDDATVKLWYVKTRRCVLTIDTYHGEATGLSFHPNGHRLTTGCQDHAAPSWELNALDPHIEGNVEYQRARLKIGAAGRE